MRNLINFAGFQLNWLICVLAAARGLPWAGPLAVLLWVLIHLRLNRGQYKTELILIIAAAVAGYALDSLLVLAGYLTFPAEARLGYLSPLWMVALWINLATTLRHSLRWLKGRVALGALIRRDRRRGRLLRRQPSGRRQPRRSPHQQPADLPDLGAGLAGALRPGRKAGKKRAGGAAGQGRRDGRGSGPCLS